MEDLRIDPPLAADERTMLCAWLDWHRGTLLHKCDGLEPVQLCTRSVEPSTMSLIGLVRHMAEVERGWFERTMLGADAPPRYYGPDNPDGDFDDVMPDACDADIGTWLADCARSRQIVAETASLDEVSVGSRPEGPITLRWILVHMIEEYARHNGHADLLRERIDGQTGE
jgi:uncharacterized damage-inducible protein DinB